MKDIAEIMFFVVVIVTAVVGFVVLVDYLTKLELRKNCDQFNAIILNGDKYYCMPETEMKELLK